MEEFDLKAIENLAKVIGENISKINPEDLHSDEIESLLIHQGYLMKNLLY